MTGKRRCLLAVLTGVLAVPSTASAADTFMGPGTNWFDGANWSSGVPTSSDDVVIDTGTVSVSGAAASARSIAFDTGLSRSGTLTIASDGSLTTSTSGTSSIGGFLVVNGTLDLADPTTFAGSANSGGINVSGTIKVDSTFTLDGNDAVLHGNINDTGGGTGRISVASGGQLIRDTDSGTQTIEPKVDDDGKLLVKTGTLSLSEGDAGSSTGSVDVSDSATLWVHGATFEASTVSGAGTLRVSGADATVGSGDTFTIANFHVDNNATFTVNKDLTLADFESDHSSRNGTGALTITDTADLANLALSSGTTTVASTVPSIALTHFLGVGGTLNLNTPATFASSSDSNGINVSGTLNIGKSLTLDGSDGVNGNINDTSGGSARIHVLSGASLVRDTDTGDQTVGPAVVNDGALSVQTGRLILSGGLTQASGTTTVGASSHLNGAVTLNGGTLGGAGDLGGPVTNTSGTVSPGSSPGVLSIDGDYTQAAGGTLRVDIAGATVGSAYDQLAVGGNATLGGTLAIVNAGGFDPPLGSAYVVLTVAGARSAQFGTLTGATVNGKEYAPHYNAHDVTLGVGLSAPANTAAPSIPSSGVTGTPVSCDPGSWTGSPMFAFSWLSDGTPIAGATAQQYTLADADAGHTITCHVVATNGVGSTPADSNPLTPGLAAPSNSAPPSLPAGGTVGDTVTCDPGTWARAATFTFAWTRDGAPIAGATGSTYKLVAADAGHVIRCVVTAHGGGGDGGPVTSGGLAVGKQEAPPTPVAITQIATLPSPHVCVSRRHFRIHLKGVSGIVQAKIQLTGLPARIVRGRALGLPIDLRGLPKGTVVVKVTITRKSGPRLVGKRTYHTCVPGRKQH